MDKLHEYQGWSGRFHELRDSIRERFARWREQHPESLAELVKKTISERNGPQDEDTIQGQKGVQPSNGVDTDYSHIYRRKTRKELVRVSTAVMGIEFSYAAETAFVSPTLLKIGVEHQHMTLVWALSPLVGFFLTPILGSMSDRCRHPFGRRRPFIILLSIGVLCGLLLVPNGEDIGYAMGDFNPYIDVNGTTKGGVLAHRSTASDTVSMAPQKPRNSHPWGIFFTIIGTVLLDFDADACQSPARAYLLDVTVPDDHARGLSTFTIMAGLGGFMGYSLGGIDWDRTTIGVMLGGHVRAVFTLITVIFIACLVYTITSFPEIPLSQLENPPEKLPDFLDDDKSEDHNARDTHEKNQTLETNQILREDEGERNQSYGAVQQDNDPNSLELEDHVGGKKKLRYTKPPMIPITADEYSTLPGENLQETSFTAAHMTHTNVPHSSEEAATLSHYLMSIILMPHSLRMVCLTNLFCWMAHVCYSLYFTDFVGEAVYGGDPKAMEGSEKYMLYENGVRFGCWGMAMYSLSCACYSLTIEKLIHRFRAKRVYIGGLLVYSTGMTLMALTKHRIGVIFFSWTAGVMYSTLFTMPYLLVAHYHAQGTFELNTAGEAKLGTAIRGLGTDIAIVSSMVFLAQFILSICMGTIVSWSGTTTAVVSVASVLSLCGALSATQIMYLDL